ncbi:aluminum-activated malate transporter 10 isoform X2 [Ricinus communis]|uniref:aluminum-activated malate transporter 10 isoform X2 n=1 Tax=Ricinus communis TaxID=3988 RepID=UPI000D69125E|nr:aluminum-activated malate transporter 10 isoform X2 [Ricinus communis]|eukprot:XP_025013065.1 aluminum-activated malate transporter 10 isoform X2 [Ricinus communis]
MAQEKKATNGVEWRINIADGSSKILVQEEGLVTRAWLGLKYLILKVWSFFKKARDVGVNDPRKVVHCLKVGTALAVVSIFYFMRPLYEGVGGNAMWAIMTVVVVFENTVGATICKSLNRVCGTTLAGMLAFSVHWVATKSGERFEPFIIGASVFILASAATFSRFIPSVKQRFDYGVVIFILTFSLVAVSGYRVDKLFALAHERLATIIIGISLCIFVSMIICPIWAGRELYTLITTNMDKLANSLDGCVDEYFNQNESDKTSDKKSLGYKCVLSSKASEESLANFARWEPAHGSFGFKHPWKQYPKIGASMRNCAYCIEALTSCTGSENQAPEFLQKQLSNVCLRVSSISSNVIRELSETVKTMKRSSVIDSLVEDMGSAVEELQDTKLLQESKALLRQLKN